MEDKYVGWCGVGSDEGIILESEAVNLPVLSIYSHELWLVTKRIRSQKQAVDVSFI